MKNKTMWTVISILLLMFFLFFITKSIDEDSWVCTDTGWIKHGNPSMSKPMSVCGKTEEKEAVEKYLRENISSISPTKEVLGGKFYILNIDWTGNNSGKVEYEDGHILVKATFDYEITINDKKDNYLVTILNFKIIQ